MSKAYVAAREKYQAVLDDAGRNDYYCKCVDMISPFGWYNVAPYYTHLTSTC